MTPRLNNFVLAGLASMAIGSAAFAGGLQRAGSLLIVPLFDNNRGFNTIITVTNDADVTPGGGTTTADQLRVEYVYIRHEDQFLPNGQLNSNFAFDCTEFNRTRILTPKDTLSVVTRTDNPNATHRGYVYIFAKKGDAAGSNSTPINWNHLIGQVCVVSAAGEKNYEMNAIAYKAVGGTATTSSDTNTNNQRDLDGVEYEKTPDLLEFPRFFAQGTNGGNTAVSELVTIALTGGSQFTTLIDLLVYNDNEEVFSANDSVRCWNARSLSLISSVFDQSFLVNTGQNTSESIGLGGVAPNFGLETGWFTARGLIASSSSTTIPNATPGTTENPAILSVLLEQVSFTLPTATPGATGTFTGCGAVIPFGGVADNGGGSLLAHSLSGL